MGSSYTPPGGGIGGTTGTTDNAITRADGTGGSTLQGSLATIDDAGGITAVKLYIANAGGFYIGNTIGGAFGSAALISGSVQILDKLGLGGSVSTPDVVVVTDAPNALALRNGANAQTLNVYNTFTDASNFERLAILWTGGAGTITTQGTGTGIVRDLVLNGATTQLSTGGNIRFYVDSSGNFIAATTNIYDIGASGGNKPRTIYAATSVLAPNIPVVDTGWTANADGGSKTAIIPAAATLSTIAPAMNLAVAGSGDALSATAAKVKAIEAALVALLLPNA